MPAASRAAQALSSAPKQVEAADTLVDRKMADFDPSTFKAQCEDALKAMVEAKRAGKKLTAPKAPATTNVTNIMEALKASLAQTGRNDRKPSKRPATSGTARKKLPAAQPREAERQG